MAYSLHPAMLAEIERPVNSGARRSSERVILVDAEPAELMRLRGFKLVGLLVIRPVRGPEIPVLAVGNTWRDAYVLEKLECRQTYREVVLHAVLELVKKVALSELGRLETDLIVQRRTLGK